MAALASISNFVSFLMPSKPQAPKNLKPNTIPLLIYTNSNPTLSARYHIPRNRDGVIPLVLTNECQSSSTDISSVVCRSLAYANTLFFKSAHNVQVIVEDNEPEEKLIGRFRREVMRAGIVQECKRRCFFENKREKKKRKVREAAKRNRKRRPWSRATWQDKEEAAKNKKDDDEQDNWELPLGKLPY